MTKPPQLDLARRKALSLRLAAAAVLRDVAVPRVGREIKASPLPQHLRDRLHEAAKEVLEAIEPWPARLDECLQKVVEERLAPLLTQGDKLAKEMIDGLRNELATRLEGLSCDACASCCDGGQPCNDSPDDALVVTKGGFCLGEIRDIFHTCCELVDARYAALGEEQGPVRPDEIEFGMTNTHRNNRNGLLIAGHIDGWLDLEGPDNRRSVVGLTIKDNAFDWPSLCRVPYVLLHELVCHAYQGLRGKGERKGAGTYCTWTEGWMDSLAHDLTKVWFESTKIRAFAVHREKALGHANELFKDRYDGQTSGLEEIEVGLRGAARDGRCHLAMAMGGLDREGGRAKVERFSLLVNLQILDLKTRDDLAQKLAGLVQDPGTTRAKQVANACDCFLETGDIGSLIRAVNALVPGG